MKPTQNLINGELYAILHKLAFPSHVITASETKDEYILRIDLPIERKV